MNLNVKIAKATITMVLSVGILGGVANISYADSLITHTMPSNETFVEFVESKIELSSLDKEALIEAEISKKSLYDRINAINLEIREIEGKILKDANPLFDKIYKIKDSNIHLVKKMDANINKNQEAVKTYEEYVNLSNVLSKEEKELLIKDYHSIQSLNKKVSVYYQNADEATFKLKEEAKILQDKIRQIDDKNNDIWDKLYK